MDGKRTRYGDRMKMPLWRSSAVTGCAEEPCGFMGSTGRDRGLPHAGLLAVNLATRPLMTGHVRGTGHPSGLVLVAVGDQLEIRPSRQWRRPSLWCRAWRCSTCPGQHRDQLRRICVVPRTATSAAMAYDAMWMILIAPRLQIACYNAQPDGEQPAAGLLGRHGRPEGQSQRLCSHTPVLWSPGIPMAPLPGVGYRPVTANLTVKRRTDDQGPDRCGQRSGP